MLRFGGRFPAALPRDVQAARVAALRCLLQRVSGKHDDPCSTIAHTFAGEYHLSVTQERDLERDLENA